MKKKYFKTFLAVLLVLWVLYGCKPKRPQPIYNVVGTWEKKYQTPNNDQVIEKFIFTENPKRVKVETIALSGGNSNHKSATYNWVQNVNVVAINALGVYVEYTLTSDQLMCNQVTGERYYKLDF